LKCPTCGEEVDYEETVYPYCGSLIEESCYDAITDEED
jgi:endogenous inhibitor of DNA gyrase (YacG/DUF329 family)